MSEFSLSVVWCGIGVGSVLLALGCGGGASVDPVAHLELLCLSAVQLPSVGDLPVVDVPSAKPPDAPVVSLGEELLWDYGQVTVSELATRQQEAVEQAKLFGVEPGVVVLQVAADTPLGRVQEVGEVLTAAGATTVNLLVGTNESYPDPGYLDPEFAESFKVTLANASPDRRQMVAAQEIESLIVACPGAQVAFNAVASAEPEMRCTLMAHGLSEALPSCPLTDGDAVVTAVQILAEPNTNNPPGLLKATLHPEGTAVPVPADATWGVVAPLLKSQTGAVWPVAEQP